MATEETEVRCGYAAIVGRPNVGKSTLLNQILGQKLSITAHKPQTTRHQIFGIKTVPRGQMIFIDTPGIHLDMPKAINRYMNRVAMAVLQDIDLVLWLVEAGHLTREDEHVGHALSKVTPPVLCVINKIDLLPDKQKLLPFAKSLSDRFKLDEVLMICARNGRGVAELEDCLLNRLPFSKPFYDADQITDRSERFLAAEFIREQVIRRLHQELPYAITVEIEAFAHEAKLVRIAAIIWVERQGQKGIVIGKQGESLKAIGAAARKNLEGLLQQKVFLQLWVKVKQGWSDDHRALQSLGYKD
jgi:GTP-binding protein Era